MDTNERKVLQSQMEDYYDESKDNDIDSSSSIIENDSNINSNIIMKNFDISQCKKRKMNDGEITCTLIAQRELDTQKIHQMTKKIYSLKLELSKVETQLHYLRLELNNENIKNEELKKELKKEFEEKLKNVNTKNYCNNFIFVISLFILITSLVF
jgi:hypothetical protein